MTPVLMEVKRPDVDEYLLVKDERKLYCMMKLSLDTMILKAVKTPEVVGLLVQGMLPINV
jgi:hypothetical protein